MNSDAPVYLHPSFRFVFKLSCRSIDLSLWKKLAFHTHSNQWIQSSHLVFVTRHLKSKASPIFTVFLASITVKRISPYSIAYGNTKISNSNVGHLYVQNVHVHFSPVDSSAGVLFRLNSSATKCPASRCSWPFSTIANHWPMMEWVLCSTKTGNYSVAAAYFEPEKPTRPWVKCSTTSPCIHQCFAAQPTLGKWGQLWYSVFAPPNTLRQFQHYRTWFVCPAASIRGIWRIFGSFRAIRPVFCNAPHKQVWHGKDILRY